MVLTFGGGYAMLPILQREVVEKRHWANRRGTYGLLRDRPVYPGHYRGKYGDLCRTGDLPAPLAVTSRLWALDSVLIIITVIAAFIQNFAHLAIVQNAFAGIRVCVCVLIFNAVVKLWKKAVVDKPTLVICLLVILGSTLTEFSPDRVRYPCGCCRNYLKE